MGLIFSTTTSIFIWAGWLALFVIIEIATVNLVTVWFAVGALVALLSSLVTNNFLYQVAVFLVVSLVALVATKPLMDKARHAKPVAAVELDRNLGRTAQVLQTIQPGSMGRVRLDGVDWNATCDQLLTAGTSCTVTDIQGTTLTVTPAKQTTTV